MPSADQFTYVVSACEDGHQIILTRMTDNKGKRFFLAGQPSMVALVNLRRHMDSLTDKQCEMFYEDNKQKQSRKQ